MKFAIVNAAALLNRLVALHPLEGDCVHHVLVKVSPKPFLGTTDGTDNTTTPKPQTSTPSTTSTPETSPNSHPRNISIEKVAQGWVITWLPPSEPLFDISYYTVQHKEGDAEWVMSQPISKENAYLSK